MRRHDNPRQQAFIARALEATLHQRQAKLTYHSKSSERTKTYLVHPYRLAYAQGGDVSARLRAGVPGRSAPSRSSACRISRCSRSASRRSRNCRTTAFPALARRALGPARARRDRVRSRPSPTTCARASGTRRSAIREGDDGAMRDDARRLPRPRAAELDSQLRPVRPRRRAGGAGARDRRATGRSHREVRLMISSANGFSQARRSRLMLALAPARVAGARRRPKRSAPARRSHPPAR